MNRPVAEGAASPSLGRRLLHNTGYALADRIGNSIATAIAFAILVRLLPADRIAVLGIAIGYLALAAYLEVGPIRVLLRDYPALEADPDRRDRLLTALFSFWGVQSAAMLLLYLLLRAVVFRPMNLPDLPFVCFGVLVDFIAQSLRGWVKTVFYASFRQAFATKLSLTLEVPRLLSFFLLLLFPSLVALSWILLANAFVTAVVWAIVFARRFRFHLRLDRELPTLLWESLNSYGLWDHLNRMIIDTLFVVDTVVLSWFALSRIEEIGHYTVALRFVSPLFLVPSQLHIALQLGLSNLEDRPRKIEAIRLFLKVNGAVAVVQFVVLLLAGRWILRLLFGAEAAAGALPYVLILGSGVTIVSLAIPFLSVVNNQCRIRAAFFRLFLPALILGVGLYALGAWLRGPLGVAWANIAVYSLLAAGLAAHTRRCYPFRLDGLFFGPAEWRRLAALIRRER